MSIKSFTDMCRRALFAWRFRRAVKQADSLAEMFRKRYLVIIFSGRLKVIPRHSVPQMIRDGLFRRGTTPEMVYRRALYATPIRPTFKVSSHVS